MTVPIPLNPTDVDTVTQPVRAGNPVMDWVNVKDSAGGMISNYRLMLDPSFYSMLSNTVYSGIVELCYAFFLGVSSYASAALQLVVQPSIWLDPLSEAYIKVTAPVFEFASPRLIVVASFAILVVQVFVVRSGPAPGATRGGGKSAGLMDQWIPSNTQIARAQWDRLGSGLVMVGLVFLLTSNPFSMMRTLLEWVIGFGEIFIPGDSAASSQAINTGNLIRTVTFLINYRDVLDTECAEQWAEAINNQGSNPSCLTASQIAATDTDLWTVVLSALALPVAWYFAKFVFQVLIRFLNYISLAIFYLVSTGFVAAVSLGRRRPYDPLVNVLSKLATNAALSGLVVLVAVVGPGAIFGVINALVSAIPHNGNGIINASVAMLQVAAITVSFFISTLVLARFMEMKETLFSVFKDKVGKSPVYTNLYDLKPGDKGFVAPLMQPLSAPVDWVKGQYQQGAEWSRSHLAQARERASNIITNTRQGGGVTAVVEDTPQMRGAQQRVKLEVGDAAQAKPKVRLDSMAAAAAGAAAAAAAAPVVLNAFGQRLKPPAPDVASADAAVSARPVERGGIPIGLLQTDPAPATPVSNVSGQTEPTAAGPGPAQSASPSMAVRTAHLEALRADAQRIQPSAVSGGSVAVLDGSEQIAATTATYTTSSGGGGGAADKDAGLAVAARKLGLLQGPNYTMLLSSAAWERGVRHQRHLLAARGIDAIPALSEETESIERMIFAERGGRPTMVRKHDRGFGDEIGQRPT
ncbi:hypothetical protein [Mycolicibacterium sp.]|uniref:hypothetical protein n=1 Tax=Mycolicibacterium sp. TaxID=2320850 RepID=UPI0037CC8DED